MSDPEPNNDHRSLREQQADLTRDLIVRAFRSLLETDHPDAITYPQVAEAAGVSLRTVYRYFPTRADLLQNAAEWFRELTDGASWDDPRSVRDMAGAVPQLGRLFDEHTNVFRALADDALEQPRRDAVAAALAEVSRDLPDDEVRQAEALLSYIRSGRAWLALHDRYGLDGDEIVAALDWASSALLEDVRRRNAAVRRS
jgi:AcrR family transcriptional regulator